MSLRSTGRAQNLEDAVRKQILNAAQPSKDENVYFVGPFARRVNFMSQQARALNLVWALAEDGILKDYPRVAIVGAGLTGLTAAAALIAKKCPLSIFAMNDSEVLVQRLSKHRFIHPTINYWPETELNPTTNLPFFDWIAGSCSDVMNSILSEWSSHFSSKLEGIKTGFKVLGTQKKQDTYALKGIGTRDGIACEAGQFNLVIFATGFGTERILTNSTTPRYWINDDIDECAALDTIARYIIGGTGDGGLIDLFRIMYNNFEEGKFLVHIAARFSSGKVANSIRNAERILSRFTNESDETARAIASQYAKIIGDMDLYDRNHIAKAMRNNLRNRVVLVGRNATPFRQSAAPIHKLLLAHLLFEGAISFVHGRIVDAADGGTQVLGVDDRDSFPATSTDKIILRLGPEISLKTFLSESDIQTLKARQEALLDTLNRQFWPVSHCGGIDGYPDQDITDEQFVLRCFKRAQQLRNIYPQLSAVRTSTKRNKLTFEGELFPNEDKNSVYSPLG